MTEAASTRADRPVSRTALGQVLAAVALLTSAVALTDAGRSPAEALVAAPISKVQGGTVARTATSSVTPTLSTASTAGTLLVATVAAKKKNNPSGSSGWVQAIDSGVQNTEAAVWYYPNNPGGITSATFSYSGSGATAGQLSEWRGVATSAPVDQTGTATTTLVAASVTPTTRAPTTVAGELAVTAAAENLVLADTPTFGAGSGWTNLGNSGTTSTTNHYTADYKTGAAVGTVSETMTSSTTGFWGAAVATFKPVQCTGASLTLTPPPSVAFPGVTLNGANKTTTASAALTPSDMSGNAAGWNVQATSTTFTNAGGKTLPTTATTVTAATAATATGNCDLPTNAITYPVTLPAAATAPTAVKVLDAAANTGGGPLTLTLSFQLAIPASAYSGSYSSTWTFTIASGP